MERISKISAAVLAVAFMLSLAGSITTFAASTPYLGVAATYGILASTYTNTTAGTTINGDVGFTTGPAVAPLGTHTNYGSGSPYDTAGTYQGSALSALASQTCTHTFGGGAIDLSTDVTHGAVGVYTPGVYCSAGAMDIGGPLNLSGSGTYIFRTLGALTSTAGAIVTLTDASVCDVYWTPTEATTLAANTTFVGTVIDAAGITVGANTTWTGRALAFGGTVITDTNTIAVSSCAVAPSSSGINYNTITVFKHVINDSGGTATFTDFPLFLNGNHVISGQSLSLAPGIYTLTETNLPGYTSTFTGNCDANGRVNHGGIGTNNDICTVVNDDIGVPPVAPIPPLIDVVKVPNPLALPAGPGLVTYTYTVKNIGTVPMTNITMVGDTCSPITLASGDINTDTRLDVNEIWTYRCSTTLSETHTNTVVATGWANGLSATDVASATVVVGAPIVPPLIHVTKVPNPLTLPNGAGMVTYTKKVTNPGTVALSNVSVTDDKCSSVNYISGDTNNDSKLDLAETWIYTCQTRLTKTTTNTATAIGSANGLIATDFALATVVVAAPTVAAAIPTPTAVGVTPKLPNTGLAPDRGSTPWNVAILAGLFAVSLFFFFTQRKRLTKV